MASGFKNLMKAFKVSPRKKGFAGTLIREIKGFKKLCDDLQKNSPKPETWSIPTYLK